jgi:hypothetical protein
MFGSRYSARVGWSRAIFFATVLFFAPRASPSDTDWAGDYANEKFLNGKAAFHLSIEHSGDVIQVTFNAGYADGHGTAPDGQGHAKISGQNTLEFKWEDSFNNSGTGRITRADRGIIVSMKAIKVVEPRCLAFYGNKMRLKRVK